jgi:hypothetical protein
MLTLIYVVQGRSSSWASGSQASLKGHVALRIVSGNGVPLAT